MSNEEQQSSSSQRLGRVIIKKKSSQMQFKRKLKSRATKLVAQSYPGCEYGIG